MRLSRVRINRVGGQQATVGRGWDEWKTDGTPRKEHGGINPVSSPVV